MKYKSGAAFRQALETRLVHQSRQGIPLVRLRKIVAFERYLARLVASDSQDWALKGGFALELRLGNKARTTKDIDLVLRSASNVTRVLRSVATIDLKDWFEFEIGEPSSLSHDEVIGGIRHSAQSLLDGRTFERFHIDVGIGGFDADDLEIFYTSDLLSFSELGPIQIPCFPLDRQLAEKVHAYTQIHEGRMSSRVKDLVDILLIAGFGEISAKRVGEALEQTFLERATHPLPNKFPEPPSSWAGPFRRLADEVDLEWKTLEDAFVAAQHFLDPILKGGLRGAWQPKQRSWA
jgi:hypothetical protein